MVRCMVCDINGFITKDKFITDMILMVFAWFVILIFGGWGGWGE